MLNVYVQTSAGLAVATDPKAALISGDFVWADIVAPPGDTDELRIAEALVEQALSIDVPTPNERSAMEDSARFFEEAAAMYLTVTVMGHKGDASFISDPVTFILKDMRLVTVRAIKPRAFEIGDGRASARVRDAKDGGQVMMALLDGVVERVADVLAENQQNANRISGEVFGLDGNCDLKRLLMELGRCGSLAALAHGSLSSLNRLSAYAFMFCPKHGLTKDRFRALSRDVQELERQAEAMQGHLSFLMDAALGLTGAAQNNTLRALAVATMAFAPATLIASIFGMNFSALGWIHQPWGPAAAFALMFLTPAGLFWIARWRKWF